MPPGSFRNRYFVLRHGHSQANQQGLIVSAPQVGIERYGLTDQGRQEVSQAVQRFRGRLGRVAKIYASDFLRTRQTAELAAEILAAPIQWSRELRERGFGNWEGRTNEHYATVWQSDAQDASHQEQQVESVQSVAERTTGLLERIDQSTQGETYLLVSHGDPLQILLTVVQHRDPRLHRRLKPLQTSEIRELA